MTAPKTDLKIVDRFISYQTSHQIIFDTNNLEQKSLVEMVREFIDEKMKTMSYQTQYIIPFFECLRGDPGKIFNPHAYIKTQKKDKFELILVKGIYEYYHYRDQNFQDNGWGCAYRSLQTLYSWLRIQGYTKTNLGVPTIPEIQASLDKLDRSRKLVGTQAWIGAT